MNTQEKSFTVKVSYRVNLEETLEFAEQIEAQRWQMFKKKFGIEPLEVKVEEES